MALGGDIYLTTLVFVPTMITNPHFTERWCFCVSFSFVNKQTNQGAVEMLMDRACAAVGPCTLQVNTNATQLNVTVRSLFVFDHLFERLLLPVLVLSIELPPSSLILWG
jgi:hypothetical protein